MRLTSIVIKNFKSLADVQLESLGDLSVFVGPSGSGKTAIIEALDLFFAKLANNSTSTADGITDKLWFLRDTSFQIFFSTEIEFTREEYDQLIPEEIAKKIGATKPKRRFTLAAAIEMEGGKPRWSNFVLGRDGALIPLGSPIPAPVSKDPELEAETSEPGTPSAPLDGDEAESDVEQQTAADKADELPDEKSNSDNLDLISIVEAVKKEFYWVQGYRATNPPPAASKWNREPYIPPEVQKRIVNLHNSSVREDGIQYAAIRKAFEAVIPSEGRLHIDTQGVQVYEGSHKFSLSSLGSGQQAYLYLIFELIGNASQIICIEEPELHVHPHLGRDLYRFFAEQSKQVILLTHSPVFLDLQKKTNNKIFSKTDHQTSVKVAKTNADLKQILEILGTEPSDALYPNKVLLLGGSTEEVVVPTWLRTLGGDPSSINFRVVVFDGDRDKRVIKTWATAMKGTLTEIYILLDDQAEDLIQVAQSQGVPDGNILLLDGSIEDTYPKAITEKHLKASFGVDWKKPDDSPVAKIDVSIPRVDEIRRILREEDITRGDGWKVGLGKLVAEEMTETDLDWNLRAFLNRIVKD